MQQVLKDYVFGSEHPDLVVYRQDFDTKFDYDHWERGIRNQCELAGFRGKRILEVGCGFGWDAVGLALVGGNRIVATDILPSMIDGAKECQAAARAKGHELDIELKVADICSSLDEADESFDGIYSSEAIEHVHDLAAMFERCYRLLKPGGVLLLRNDSNRYNSEFREATFEMWKERDASWEHADWLRNEVRPVEHANAKPYGAMRAEIIAETGIDFTSDELERLVAATAGMIRPEILKAAKAFRDTGILPTPPQFSWCRNPETGEYAERLLDPFELRDMLRAAGFRDVSLQHGFSKFPFRLANRINFRPVNEILFDRRGLFHLLARK